MLWFEIRMKKRKKENGMHIVAHTHHSHTCRRDTHFKRIKSKRQKHKLHSNIECCFVYFIYIYRNKTLTS